MESCNYQLIIYKDLWEDFDIDPRGKGQDFYVV